jgi:pantetheine-phosphate adenylyltransferase
MSKIAVFPGSFDPITLGHASVIRRAVPLFDKVIVAIGINAEKKHMFSIEQRLHWIEMTFRDEPKVEVDKYEGLTTAFCREHDANYILRGLRTAADFEFERGIGQINRRLDPSIETVFLLTEAFYTPITSSIVRDVIRHGGDISELVPEIVFKENGLDKAQKG